MRRISKKAKITFAESAAAATTGLVWKIYKIACFFISSSETFPSFEKSQTALNIEPGALFRRHSYRCTSTKAAARPDTPQSRHAADFAQSNATIVSLRYRRLLSIYPEPPTSTASLSPLPPSPPPRRLHPHRRAATCTAPPQRRQSSLPHCRFMPRLRAPTRSHPQTSTAAPTTLTTSPFPSIPVSFSLRLPHRRNNIEATPSPPFPTLL